MRLVAIAQPEGRCDASWNLRAFVRVLTNAANIAGPEKQLLRCNSEANGGGEVGECFLAITADGKERCPIRATTAPAGGGRLRDTIICGFASPFTNGFGGEPYCGNDAGSPVV